VFVYTETGYVPEITWTNCADEMPPYNRRYIILKLERSNKTFLKLLVSDELRGMDTTCWHWTPYTPEKWEELNK
jgi:hypothetical protein